MDTRIRLMGLLQTRMAMKGYRNPSLIQKVFQKIVNRYKSRKINNRNPLG